MTLTCQRCGEKFEAKSPRAKWCSERCRKAVQRGADVVALPTAAAEPEPVVSGVFVLDLGPVGSATYAELEKADRLDTPAGRVALALANRIDRPKGDTGSAMAAVARQHATALADALRSAGARTAPGQLQDQLAARRAAHGA